jgi:hypothetical protein
MYECRCDERPRPKVDGYTLLGYTVLCGGLEHLKIETRLRDERFVSVKGELLHECDVEPIGVPSIFKTIP